MKSSSFSLKGVIATWFTGLFFLYCPPTLRSLIASPNLNPKSGSQHQWKGLLGHKTTRLITDSWQLLLNLFTIVCNSLIVSHNLLLYTEALQGQGLICVSVVWHAYPRSPSKVLMWSMNKYWWIPEWGSSDFRTIFCNQEYVHIFIS